ncbi:MAG: aminotransferase class III-fold pyridoxal phosphate-dependent enzyme [Syntrophomonadaceae bacterium]
MAGWRKNLFNPTLSEVLEVFKLDMEYVKGEGPYLWDSNGVRYIDFIAQYGAVPFGYNPDFIWEKLNEVRTKGIPSLVQPSYPVESIKLANLLAEITPGQLCYCTFCQSGTEAVEAAIKLARSTTRKEIIVSTTNSFHGKTLGSLSATGKRSYQEPFRAPAPGFACIPFNDIEALSELLQDKSDQIAAFIVEPVQGEGGIFVADNQYLRSAQKLCNDYGVLFIVDEIQTGLGRTGAMFASDRAGIEPDIMVLAKALGGGLLPIGVCISSPRSWNEDFGMLHSSTFANNNLTCVIGRAVIERLLANDRQLIREAEKKGNYLLDRVLELKHKYPNAVKEVRGKGLMVGVEFNDLRDCGSYDMSYMIDQGAFTALLAGFLLHVYNIRIAPFLNNSMTLRLEPPLTITYEQIDYVIKALEKICHIIEYRDFAKLYRYLIDDYSKPGVVIDYRPVSRVTKHSALGSYREANRFAFIIHYPGVEDVIINNPSFADYTRQDLSRFTQWQASIDSPGIVSYMPALRSKTGDVAEGWLIGVPFGGREIMSLPKNRVVECISRAVDLGRDLGARIVGLGALTSVVTRGGRAVTGKGVAITSGNSFTTLMAVQALFLGASKMHIPLETARGGIVGATGSIGRACALMMSEKISHLILFGNPKYVTSSKNRLNSLVKDILNYALIRMQNKELQGMSRWLKDTVSLLTKLNRAEAQKYAELIVKGEDLSWQLIKEICDYLGINCPIVLSLDLEKDLPKCNLIITASNSPEYLIYPGYLAAGTVVCDVARPADVAPEVLATRNDVLVLEGGLVQLPDQVCFGPNLGYRDGISLGCLSETMLLALEGEYQDYSIGTHLSLDTINYFRKLAAKHGFTLASLRMGRHEISDSYIDNIYRNSIKYKMVENI